MTPAEKAIQDALLVVIGHTNEGVHPNEAITKVATDRKMTPDQTRRLIEGFNISRTLAQYEKADTPEKRASEFPIASPEAVMGAMYPSEPVGATDEVVSVKDYTVKEAVDFATPKEEIVPLKSLVSETPTVAPCTANSRIKPILDKKARAERAADDAMIRARGAVHHLMGAIAKVAAYFKQPRMLREDFGDVEERIRYLYPDEKVAAMLDYIHTSVGQTVDGEVRKAAAARDLVVDHSSEPIALFENCIDKMDEMYKAAQAAAEANIEKDDALEELTKLGGKGLTSLSKGLASGLPRTWAMMRAMPTGLGGREPLPGYRADLVEVMDKAFDPEHELELQRYRAQDTLNRLVAYDPVVRDYPLEDVRTAYQQIAENFPGVTSSPLLLRAQLRRLLQQQDALEAFDLSQLAQLEAKVKPGLVGGPTEQALAAEKAAK